MDDHVESFRRQYNGTCLNICARKLFDRTALLRIFCEIIEATKPLDESKILLDLQDTHCDLELDDLVALKVELRSYPSTALSKIKLAMVTIRHPNQYDRLRLLMLPLSQLGIGVALFYETARAIDWLAQETNQRSC
mgnify:FL=1